MFHVSCECYSLFIFCFTKLIFDIRLHFRFTFRTRGVAWLTCQLVKLKIASSNLVGSANNLSLIPRRERRKAPVGITGRGFFFVFAFQRVGALFSDDPSSFERLPLSAFKISTGYSN